MYAQRDQKLRRMIEEEEEEEVRKVEVINA